MMKGDVVEDDGGDDDDDDDVDDDDDDNDVANFFPAGSAPLTAQGQPAGSARGTFTR